jgi:hypothetical protein
MLIGLPVQKFGLGKLGTYYLANNIDVFAFEAYRGTTLQSDSSQFESILQKVGVSFQRGKKNTLKNLGAFQTISMPIDQDTQ